MGAPYLFGQVSLVMGQSMHQSDGQTDDLKRWSMDGRSINTKKMGNILIRGARAWKRLNLVHIEACMCPIPKSVVSYTQNGQI